MLENVSIYGKVLMLRYTDILYHCVFPTLWQQTEEEPNMGVRVMCPIIGKILCSFFSL